MTAIYGTGGGTMEERHEQAHACQATALEDRSSSSGPVSFDQRLPFLCSLMTTCRSCRFDKGGILFLCI
jgi:hypothetical protein